MESEVYGANIWNSIQENFPHLKGEIEIMTIFHFFFGFLFDIYFDDF